MEIYGYGGSHYDENGMKNGNLIWFVMNIITYITLISKDQIVVELENVVMKLT